MPCLLHFYSFCSGFCVTKNTVYRYPDIWVCLYNTYGCDSQDLEEECFNSATLTEGEGANVMIYPGDLDHEQKVPTVGKLTETVSAININWRVLR